MVDHHQDDSPERISRVATAARGDGIGRDYGTGRCRRLDYFTKRAEVTEKPSWSRETGA